MPGIFGSEGDVEPDTLAETVVTGPRHDLQTVSEQPTLGLIHHGSIDPEGWDVIEDDEVVGLLYGSLTTRDLHPASVRDLIRRPLERLPHLDGPFAFAGYDRTRDELILATDKLATRSLYYTPSRPITFGSELSTALAGVADPTIDSGAVSDILLMGKVWGDKTLVTDVKRVRPGSFVKISNDGVRSKRYWAFTFQDPPAGEYAHAVADRYREAITAVLQTIPNEPGVWLSGGLDSRILVGGIQSAGRDFHAVSYRRPTEHERDLLWDDVDVARRVAERLGQEHEVIDLNPTRVLDRLDELIRITDGQVAWPPLMNLGAVLDREVHGTEVMLEGPVPLLTGEKVEFHHLGADQPVADTLAELHAYRDPDTVAAILGGNRDPLDTYRSEAEMADYAQSDDKILAVTNDNYYSTGHFLSNKIARARVGTRETLVHTSLLELLSRMPAEMRRQSLPYTSLPHVPGPLKLKLARQLGRDVSHIPYSMTKLPPSAPYALHGISFPLVTAIRRATSDRSVSTWMRTHPDFRTRMDSLIKSAQSRDVFDSYAVEEVWDQHRQGDADHLGLVGAITTVELFHQEYIDTHAPITERPAPISA